MPKGMNLKVVILIPTMNRSEFLIRQLRYYASVKSQHPVYIGDASNQEHQERTEKVIDDLQAQITIRYNHWPKLNDRDHSTINRGVLITIFLTFLDFTIF